MYRERGVCVCVLTLQSMLNPQLVKLSGMMTVMNNRDVTNSSRNDPTPKYSLAATYTHPGIVVSI